MSGKSSPHNTYWATRIMEDLYTPPFEESTDDKDLLNCDQPTELFDTYLTNPENAFKNFRNCLSYKMNGNYNRTDALKEPYYF